MTNPPKEKEKSPVGDPLDGVFDLLEKKVEALALRLRSALEENGRLKSAAAAGDAEREKLKAELGEARKSAGAGSEAAETLKRYETERADVRRRIERLIASLERA